MGRSKELPRFRCNFRLALAWVKIVLRARRHSRRLLDLVRSVRFLTNQKAQVCLGKGVDKMTTIILLIFCLAVFIGLVWPNDLAKKRYAEDTPERRKLLLELTTDNRDWSDTAYLINKAGFRNEEGDQFSADEVQNEHAEAFLKEREDT